MQNTDCFYELDEKQMVRYTEAEADADGTERNYPKFVSIFDDGEEENDSKGNNWYLKPDIDGTVNVQENIISVEINHNENSCAHDAYGKLGADNPCATTEDTEA